MDVAAQTQAEQSLHGIFAPPSPLFVQNPTPEPIPAPVQPLQPAPKDLFKSPRLESVISADVVNAMESAALKQYLDPEPPLSDKQYDMLVREVFRLAFRNDKTDLKSILELHPFRVRACWRIIRELGRVRGDIPGDAFLSEGLGSKYDNEDPWTHPKKFELPPQHLTSGANGLLPIPPELYRTIWASQKLDEGCYPNYIQMSGTDNEIDPGFAYLPPDVPRKFIDTNGHTSEQYSPSNDPLLKYFMDAIQWVAKYLRVYEGSLEDRLQGKFGMMGLNDPHLIRFIFPTRTELLTWERMLLEDTIGKMAEIGVRKTQLFLEAKYGLMSHETASMIKLGKAWIRSIGDSDLEDERALMTLQLDNLAARAREDMDLRTELMTLKQKALVQGLNRVEIQDEMSDFIGVVRKVSGERDRRALPAAIDADFTED